MENIVIFSEGVHNNGSLFQSFLYVSCWGAGSCPQWTTQARVNCTSVLNEHTADTQTNCFLYFQQGSFKKKFQ